MKKTIKHILILAIFCISLSLSAFNDGFVFGMKAHFSGSATEPHISKEELAKMGSTSFTGNVGFIIQGGMDFTYIFDSKKYFNMESNDIFGGLGFGGYIEIGQGYIGQVSGAPAPINKVFVNVFFTPVVHFGTTLKTYLLSNRFVLGLGLGGRMIADPTPMFEQYSADDRDEKDKDVHSKVDTLIVTSDMMKKMNPFAFQMKGSLEYIQPVLDRLEFVLGGFMAYNIYKPGYVSMPPELEKMAKDGVGFDAKNTKLNSFYLNSFDFGVTLGINFKVTPWKS